MSDLPKSFMELGAFDGARGEPPYTVTDMDETERNERERCAVIAEQMGHPDVADAIRNQ